MANIQQLPDESQVQKIIQLHNEVELVAQTIMQKAVIIGELLTKVKASLPHGTFVEYTTNTFPFKIRTAQMYMKAFARRDLIDSGEINALHQLNEKNAESAHLITSEHLQLLINGDNDSWTLKDQKQYDSELKILGAVIESKNATPLDIISAEREFVKISSLRLTLAKITREKIMGKPSDLKIRDIPHEWLIKQFESDPEYSNRNFPQFNF